MKQCDGCRFCCWSFHITELQKPGLVHCPHECAAGCSVYNLAIPVSCKLFDCPYLTSDDLYRPDVFQNLLESLDGDLGAYIPAIPLLVDKQEALDLIKRTRSVLADVQIDMNMWMRTVVPLDREKDGSWFTGSLLYQPWQSLCDKYNAEFKAAIIQPWFAHIK